MSRKSGKPPRKNPFLKKDRGQLLEELHSIQEMLGEAGEDVGEEGIPTLAEEGDAPASATGEGDAENQIPLLAPDENGEQEPAAANERLRQALQERENPFLSAAGKAAREKTDAAAARATGENISPSEAHSEAEEPPQKTAPDNNPERPTASATTPGTLDEQEMRALADEVLAAWLPKIERELRARLMEYLRDAGR